MRSRLLGSVSLVIALGGCALAPTYHRPDAPVPPAFAGADATAAALAGRAAEIPWRTYFADPGLRQVLELALANNRDLRVAALTIERAQALYRIRRSELLPTVDGVAQGDVSRLPRRMSPDSESHTIEQYAAQVSTSWEADLFGRVRSLNAAALEEYLGTEHARRATQISLVSGVASTYLSIAAHKDSLRLSEATLNAHLSMLALIERSRQEGIASDLDHQQVLSQVEQARAAVAAYRRLLEVERHALDALVGAPVPADLLPTRLEAVTTVRGLEPGLPSEVLLSRPDILATEQRLRAANANIGAARAAFFPRIALTGSAGTLSPDLSKLFHEGSGTWSFVPQVGVPIFNMGRLKANLQATQVERDIAVTQYERSIQEAFREVSDALTLRTRLAEQRAAETSLVAALDATQRLSDARYKAGMDSYLQVLVADRTLFAGQQELVRVRLAEQVNLVTLYKVLGGGA